MSMFGNGKPMTPEERGGPAAWGCLAVVVLCGLAWLWGNIGMSPRPSVATGRGEAPGTRRLGVAGKPEAGLLLVAVDRESLDAYTKALTLGDRYGTAELLKQGKVYLVPAGTEVLVIGSTFTLRNVRILSGKHAGKSAWIEAELVLD